MYIACKKCKYNHDGECVFYVMGSGNEIDMPCYREKELIKEASDNFLQAFVGVEGMTREQQYWEDTQEALSRVFDKCEEIDSQNGYDMLEDIQFIRGFINKHKPRTEKQESVLNKIRAEIANRCGVNTDYCDSCRFCTDSIGVREILQIIDKYKSESEETCR